MIGPEAGEVMSVVQMAMLAGFPYNALRDAILTHPKAGDGMSQAAVRAEKDALASPGTHRQILRNPPGTHCPTMI